MKQKLKQFVSMAVAVAIAASMGIFCSAESYWDVREDYMRALEAWDGDAMISCVKRLEQVYANPRTVDEYSRLATPFEQVALVYEQRTQYRQAYEYYSRSLKYYTWLDNAGIDYRDKLMCLQAMLRHLSGYFTLYTEALSPVSNPDNGALHEPSNGTYYGSCDWHPFEQSAQLIYARFYDENIYDFFWLLPKEEDNNLVEIAWNVPHENLADLQGVCDQKNWEYIKKNVDWMASQNYRFLLRFGAEINCWSDLDNHSKEEYISAFRAAFIRIADYVHECAPNVAMVYSPNDISNWYYSITDFYPGDEYVDWVGVSSYCNVPSVVDGTVGSQVDAWYSRGVYENQIVKLQELVEAFGDRKPIVISECGFCYHSTTGLQTEEHAAAALRYFYTYINMVYPQVKAVYYFNTDYGKDNYRLTGNEKVLSAYTDTVRENVSMQATTGEEKKYYVPLDSFNEKAESLHISAFAYYPGSTANVRYQLDGETIYSGSSYPYTCTVSSLTPGLHKLQAEARFGSTTLTKDYGLYVDEEGRISTLVSAMRDLSQNSWAYDDVAYCMHYGMFHGMSSSAFDPNGTMTRGMMVTVLYRMEGSPQVSLQTPFTDVSEKRYYYDAVCWAYQHQIIEGMSETVYAPDKNITREQAATILFRYAREKGYDVTGRADYTVRPDWPQISRFASEAFSWSMYSGVIKGDQNGFLHPKDSATRAEMAAMLMGFRTAFVN